MRYPLTIRRAPGELTEVKEEFKGGESYDDGKDNLIRRGQTMNSASETQDNFNTGSNGSSGSKGATTEDHLSVNDTDIQNMIGFGGSHSNGFQKLIDQKTPIS